MTLPNKSRASIAVVSPFLNKRQGTERAVVECFSRLAGEYDVQVYSQSVEDLDLAQIQWHRIPTLPGPHLFNYLWWFVANRVWRSRIPAKGRSHVVFSPGINCLDADVIAVHIVFAEFLRQTRAELSLRKAPLPSWPRLLHRKIYYRLIASLESRVYRRPEIALVAVSHKVADDLNRHYGRTQDVRVVYHAIDARQFSVGRRAALRDEARRTLAIEPGNFALLLVGNDWKKKGLHCLIEALREAQRPSLRLLVVGRDNPAPFSAEIARAGLRDRIRFLPPRPDVEFYYAAADAYVGPSLEDAFSLPPAEAMACGLPVIASRHAGVSEIMTDGKDAMILEDPADARALATMLRRLATDPNLCLRLGQAASTTTLAYTWDRNAAEMKQQFDEVLANKTAKERLRSGESD